MKSSPSSPTETGAQFQDDAEGIDKTTHSRSMKRNAPSYIRNLHSNTEMMAATERDSSETSRKSTHVKRNNSRRTRHFGSSNLFNRSNRPPLHFGRIGVELGTVKDMTTGIRDEVTAYSNLEHRYVRELGKKLPKCEGMGDIRMHMTVDQLARIRKYRRSALSELTEMTGKVAALEARIERIAYEAVEAELNATISELDALYCVPDIQFESAAPPTIDSFIPKETESKPKTTEIPIPMKNAPTISTEKPNEKKGWASIFARNKGIKDHVKVQEEKRLLAEQKAREEKRKLEDQKRRLEAEKRLLEEEKARLEREEDQKRRLEAEKRLVEEQHVLLEEEKARLQIEQEEKRKLEEQHRLLAEQKAKDEKRKLEEEKAREEKRKLEDQKRKLEEEKRLLAEQKAKDEKRKLEEEKAREEKRKLEDQKRRLEAEKRLLEEEKARLEREEDQKRRLEDEKRKLEEEKAREEKRKLEEEKRLLEEEKARLEREAQRTEIIEDAPVMESTPEETTSEVQNKEVAEVPLPVAMPSITVSDKQVQSLKRLLEEYKKNNDPLSSSKNDSSSNGSAASVDTKGVNMMQRTQVLVDDEDSSETVEDLLQQHLSKKRGRISLGSFRFPFRINKKRSS